MNLLRKITFVTFFIVIMIDQSVNAQKNPRFLITSSIMGLKEGEMVRLSLEPIYGGHEMPIDSCEVRKGAFKLQGHISDGPRLVILRIGNTKYQFERRFMLDNEKIKLQGKIGSQVDKYFAVDTSFHVIGGRAEIDRRILIGPLVIWNSGIYKLRIYLDYLKDSTEYNNQLMEALENTKLIFENEIKNVFAFNLYNKSLPYFFLSLPPYIRCDSFFVTLYRNMGEGSRNSYYGKLMKGVLQLSEGNLAPEFSSSTVNGPIISLKGVIDKSKLTIVDFWGSTCGPCRKEFRSSLVPLYKEFHDKGLNVIGVSWDDYKSEKWRKAILDDHLTWYQVAGQDIFALYKPWSGASPANVLIDQNGRIVAWNLFGMELHCYLDRYFRN